MSWEGSARNPKKRDSSIRYVIVDDSDWLRLKLWEVSVYHNNAMQNPNKNNFKSASSFNTFLRYTLSRYIWDILMVDR